ncbi:threonine--tRNA ligase, partial [Candidatus Roizmanbacteria bacterium CG_4_10_14_3_um_filter_33_21]
MSKVLDEKLLKLSKKELELHKLRHTAEHVLHTAMQNLYPQLKKAMGPATDEGFYFDFDVEDHISEDHFPKIEAEMKRLINKNLKLVQDFITPDEAKKNFANNPYKLEWVEQIVQRGEHISIYKMVDHDDGVVDLDLCSGPHANYTSEIKAFKLLSVAGAYWHGDEKNKMLTRIYGTVWPSK